MNCSFPPPLTDDEIEALIANQGDQALINHLANCASCAARFRQAKAFETALKRRLHRWDCPSADMLADFHMNLLSGSDRDRVAKHIDVCPHCQSEIGNLRAFLESDSQPKSRPMPGSMTMTWKPRYEAIARVSRQTASMALRGKTSGPMMVQTASGITVFLELQSETTQTVLVGQMVAEQQDWTGALVKVFQSQQIQATTLVSEMGDFRCTLTDTSPISLQISAENKRTIVIENLAFDE